nr:hypothetical protein [uncultured Cetobacterium sp.]
MINLYDIELAKKITGEQDPEILKFYLDSLINKIEGILGYTLALSDRTEIIRGINKTHIYVKTRPLKSVLECTFYGANITDSISIVDNKKIDLGFQLCSNENINLKYTAGFEEFPKSIQMFLFSQVMGITNKLDFQGIESYKIKDISYSFTPDLDKEKAFENEVKNLFGAIWI